MWKLTSTSSLTDWKICKWEEDGGTLRANIKQFFLSLYLLLESKPNWLHVHPQPFCTIHLSPSCLYKSEGVW